MTTTRELRAALGRVEPAFPGVEVEELRRRAQRIRRKHRVVGAVAGCVVAASVAVSLPHLPAPTLTNGAAEAALPGGVHYDAPAAKAAGPQPWPALQKRTGPLPIVWSTGPRIDIGVGGDAVWLERAASAGGPGRFCYGNDLRPPTCSVLARQQKAGVAAMMGAVDSAGETTLLMAVEAPVRRAVATAGGRSVPVKMYDLGHRYEAVVVPIPSAAADDDLQVRVFDDRDRLIAEVGRPPAAVTEPGRRVPLASPGGRIWLAPPNADSANPQLCIEEPASRPTRSCSEISADASSGVLSGYTTEYSGRVLELIVTNRAFSRVTGRVDGKPVPVSVLDLGYGYSALQADFEVKAKTDYSVSIAAYLGDWSMLSFGFQTEGLSAD